MWGQGFSHFLGWILKGIIPTRVGTSVVYPICKHIFEDHPHACGDKMDSGNQPSRERGSSPRVWGQGTNRGCIPCAPGIIPTRVGTRNESGLYSMCARDHPHACGDKVKILKISTGATGSSPRVWGQGLVN